MGLLDSTVSPSRTGGKKETEGPEPRPAGRAPVRRHSECAPGRLAESTFST
jgi:hypothetical protein